MNNYFKGFTLVTLMLFSLTACSNPVVKDEAPKEINSSESNSLEPNSFEPNPSDINSPSSLDGPVAQEESDLAAVDVISEAVEDRYDKELTCSLLMDDKEGCEFQVNDLIASLLLSEIYSSFDIDRCGELPTAFAEDCKKRLNEIGVIGPVTAEENLIFQDAVGGTLPSFEEDELAVEVPRFPTYDDDKCTELKTSGYREYCEKVIAQKLEGDALIEITDSGDSSRCGELLSDDNKSYCRYYFGLDTPPEALIESNESALDSAEGFSDAVPESNE